MKSTINQPPLSLRDTASVKAFCPTAEVEKKVFSDSKLQYRQAIQVQDNVLSRFLKWLSKKLFNRATDENLRNTRKLIIWIIVIISISVVVRLLLKSEFTGLTRAAPKATAFSFSDVTEDLNQVNFEKRISEALLLQDFRLATRWHFLKVLFLLDQKKQIVFAPFKTNFDYRYELKGKNLETDFVKLSRTYEYVWYGQFVITEINYYDSAESFRQFEQKINV